MNFYSVSPYVDIREDEIERWVREFCPPKIVDAITIPASIGQLTTLEELHLNIFSGPPEEIGNLTNLIKLSLILFECCKS